MYRSSLAGSLSLSLSLSLVTFDFAPPLSLACLSLARSLADGRLFSSGVSLHAAETQTLATCAWAVKERLVPSPFDPL